MEYEIPRLIIEKINELIYRIEQLEEERAEQEQQDDNEGE